MTSRKTYTIYFPTFSLSGNVHFVISPMKCKPTCCWRVDYNWRTTQFASFNFLPTFSRLNWLSPTHLHWHQFDNRFSKLFFHLAMNKICKFLFLHWKERSPINLIKLRTRSSYAAPHKLSSSPIHSWWCPREYSKLMKSTAIN